MTELPASAAAAAAPGAPIRWRRLLLALMLLCLGLPLPLALVLQLPLPAGVVRAIAAPPLASAVPPAGFPPLGLDAWWRRDFQTGFEDWFADHAEPRGWTVRITNQLYFTLFGRSHVNEGRIVVGRGGNLFEINYLKSYCRRTPTDAELAAFAARIGALAERLRSSGQGLVLLLTPSKAAIMPEFLPADLCEPQPGVAAVPTRFAALVRQAGVPVVDGVELAEAAKAADPLPPFPPGGIHWSNLLSLHAAGLLLDALGRAAGADFGSVAAGPVRWDAAPVGTDRDLAKLLNVLAPPDDYVVGSAEPVCRSAPAGPQPDLVAVGGSFLIPILSTFARCGLFRSIEQYFYYTRWWARYPERALQRVERASLDWRARLAPPTVLILELNASRIDGKVAWMNEFLDDALAALD
jgi:hypothetical protein